MKTKLLIIAFALIGLMGCQKDKQNEIGYRFVSYSETGHQFFNGSSMQTFFKDSRNETELKQYEAGTEIVVSPLGSAVVYLEVYKNGQRVGGGFGKYQRFQTR